MKYKFSWQPTDQLIAGHHCAKYTRPRAKPEDESFSLIGRGGEMWQYSPGILWAAVFSRGEEKLVRNIPEADINEWCKRLKIPKHSAAQCRIANSRT